MRNSLRIASCCLLLGFAARASLADGGDTLVWRCWYDQEVHIVCLIQHLPPAASTPPENAAAALPGFVRMLRTNPAALNHRPVYIPLLTKSYDAAFAEALAKASICGTRPDCAVSYSQTLPGDEEIAALLGRDRAAGGAAEQGEDP